MPSSKTVENRIKHKILMQTLANNPKAAVWFRIDSSSKWEEVQNPCWADFCEYVLVQPRYARAWAAYMDGELEIRSSYDESHWVGWNHDQVPKFTSLSRDYRRRPKVEQVAVRRAGRTQDEMYTLISATTDTVTLRKIAK